MIVLFDIVNGELISHVISLCMRVTFVILDYNDF